VDWIDDADENEDDGEEEDELLWRARNRIEDEEEDDGEEEAPIRGYNTCLFRCVIDPFYPYAVS
jgi:hypothetical protein